MSTPKRPKTHWNYRVFTKFHKEHNIRIFGIIECYYTNGVLDSYSGKENFYEFDSLEDVMSTHKLIGEAFAKPTIDLDNFPHEWEK